MDSIRDTKDQPKRNMSMKMPLTLGKMNLSKVFAPVAIMAMTAFPSLLKSQETASADNTPPVPASASTHVERAENTKTITGDTTTARMTLKYGNASDAQEYSAEAGCFVIKVFNGKETGYTLEQLADIIQTHIVKNSMDVTYFLDNSLMRDDGTAITSAWSNGVSLYKPNSDADYVFNLNELNESFEAFKKIHQSKEIKTASLDLNK